MNAIPISYSEVSSRCNSQVQGSKTKTSELKNGMELADKEFESHLNTLIINTMKNHLSKDEC